MKTKWVRMRYASSTGKHCARYASSPSPTVATGNGGALINALVKALTGDKDDDVREWAAKALGEIGKSHPTVATGNGGALIKALVKALTGDKDLSVRWSEKHSALRSASILDLFLDSRHGQMAAPSFFVAKTI